MYCHIKTHDLAKYSLGFLGDTRIMRDDFYEQAFHSLPSSKSPTGQGLGLLSDVSRCLLLAPAGLLLFVIFIPVVVAVATRILSGRPSKRISDKNARSIAVLPYWFPFIGHSISL